MQLYYLPTWLLFSNKLMQFPINFQDHNGTKERENTLRALREREVELRLKKRGKKERERTTEFLHNTSQLKLGPESRVPLWPSSMNVAE